MRILSRPLSIIEKAGICALLALTYYLVGQFSLFLTVPPDYATAIWPPSGIALAALLVAGYWCWPGIFIGSFILHLVSSFDPSAGKFSETVLASAFSIASGSVLQSIAGAWLVKRFVIIPNSLERARDIGLLILVGGPISCLINSIIGTTTLALAGGISWTHFGYSWFTWWVGDSIGVIVFTPILLLLFTPGISVSPLRKAFVSLSLSIAFIISVYIFIMASQAEFHARKIDFEQKVEDVKAKLSGDLHTYLYILDSIERLFDASDNVSSEEFKIFVEKLFKEYPGIHALTWNQRVFDDQRENYENMMRHEGHQNFHIVDRTSTGERVIAEKRDEYFPITFVEFPSNGEKRFGFDSYGEMHRKEALDTARDNNQTILTSRVSIFQDDQKLSAVVMYHPIYNSYDNLNDLNQKRTHLQGFASGVFVISKMLQGITDIAHKKNLEFSLYDKSANSDLQLLYNSSENSKEKININKFEYEETIPVAGRSWVLRIHSSNGIYNKNHNWTLWLVLAAGLLFTGLFGVFLLIVTGRTDVVKRLVDEKTEKLVAQELILEEINRLNNAVLSSAKYIIVATDAQGKIIVFNREAEQSLGYSSDEVMQNNKTPLLWHDLHEMRARAGELSKELNHHVSPNHEVFQVKALKDGSETREWNFIRKDGSRFPVELSVTPLLDNDGQAVGFLGVAQDITERKKIERMKSDFISTVSHELRTPLTSIRGSLGLIASGNLGVLPPKIDPMVKIAHKNSERLVRIINDILDIEKIESGKMQMNIQAIKAKDFVQSALESNQSYGDKYQVKFVLKDAPEDLIVLGDPDRLMQVMANLLSNSAKFSPQNSEVSVIVSMKDGKARFEVKDRGTGIPEEFRSRIFEKFAQADASSTRRFDGTGLGLSITKQFIEAMHGQIGFETETGKGTTFFFELPQVRIGSQHKTDNQSPSILICENDQNIADFIKLSVEHAGFSTERASTIKEAREKLKEKSFSAITLDIGMPDVNGADFLKELRSHSSTFSTPVLVISAKASETKKIMNGDAIGVVDWLTKPIDKSKLLHVLQRSIDHASEKMPYILHVEDDEDLTRILGESLRGRSHLISAPTLNDAYKELKSKRFNLIILDLALPDGSGLELLEHIRKNDDFSIPVLILSATETTHDVQQKVAKALVKSRMSEDKIAETIMTLLQFKNDQNKDIRNA